VRRSQPKLKERILEIASPLFLQEGFDQVDMRTIARKADIAVGTLYNYFPNKRVLFFEVFESGWEEVFSKINRLCSQKKNTQEKIKVFLEEFHQAVIERRGLGLELLKLSLEAPEEKSRIKRVEKRLKEQLSQMLNKTSLEERFCYPLARCLLSSTWSVSKENQEQAELHFEFIDWLLQNFIANKGAKNDEQTG